MGVTLSNQDGVLTAALSGDIDHHTARELRLAIDEAIERDKPGLLLLDFQGVDFMDSSGIGLVMGRYKVMQQNGGEVEVTHVPKYISRVFKLSGLEQLGVMEKKARPQKRNTEEEADNETR